MLSQIVSYRVIVKNTITNEGHTIKVSSPYRLDEAVKTAKADILAAQGRNNRRVYPRYKKFAEIAWEDIAITAETTYQFI